MRLRVLLADAAQADAATGKVNTLGMGWTAIPTPVPAFALVVFFDIDWDETNQRHKFRCELVDDDGTPVVVATTLGSQPVVFEAVAEAGRPPGATHGVPIRMPLTIGVGAGLPLAPGRYEWRVTVEGLDLTEAEAFEVVGPVPS